MIARVLTAILFALMGFAALITGVPEQLIGIVALGAALFVALGK